MSNRAAEMEEAVAKAITNTKERHFFNKKLFERSMESKWREIVEEEKARTRMALEKQPLSFKK